MPEYEVALSIIGQVYITVKSSSRPKAVAKAVQELTDNIKDVTLKGIKYQLISVDKIESES